MGIKKILKKFVLSGILCLALVTSFLMGTLHPTIEADAASTSVINSKNKIFETPEEAVTYAVKKIADNDFLGVLDAFALNELRNYNLAAASEYVGSYIPSREWYGNNKMYQDMNEIFYAYNVTQQLKAMIWSLLMQDQDYHTPSHNTKFPSDQLAVKLNPSKLAGLKIEKIEKDYIRPSLIQRKKDDDKRIAAYYGVQDMMECAVLYSWNGGYYSSGFTLLKVDGGWKIRNFGAAFFGADSSGQLKKTTKYEFDNEIAEMKKEK